jgi:hypothetical protein
MIQNKDSVVIELKVILSHVSNNMPLLFTTTSNFQQRSGKDEQNYSEEHL